ncbi:MAG: Thiosulfate sulfurtransferase PspE precursor [Candidatus Heimdallarchaeota archaeon LC_3]|nr:MAG: Thiosulfate sulfurtransferase PspE precursor [Candidatus Heimdallarchaeota archaeon LC_3]
MRKREIIWYFFLYFPMYAKYSIARKFGQKGGVEDISVQEAKEEYDRANLIILDLRFKETYDKGHIEGSINLEAQDVKKNLALLPRDKTIAVMCWGGGLSQAVTKMLLKKGFTNARNLKGGMTSWALEVDSELKDYIW